MMRTLRKCKHCGNNGLNIMGEAGHTRLYFCPRCGKQTTQYLKKEVKCKHLFEGVMCIKCGYQKSEKYV